MALVQVDESCGGCYFHDYYADCYYCCLDNPDIDCDGFCHSFEPIEIHMDEDDGLFECQIFHPD